MFAGFELEHEQLDQVVLRFRHGGSGPPLVLIHGHPRTHTTWHAVAPLLASSGRTVVCPDLRGYGGSTMPRDVADHAQSSKRAMAQDVVDLMRRLGHDRFAVVGHDRGALVAFRLAMDHPELADRLVVMDGLPVVEHLERTDARFAQEWWHWWFLGQTAKPAERVICADPDAWYSTPGPEVIGEGNHADLWESLRRPEVVHGMCEDYRAGLGIDRRHDETDRASARRVACPTMLMQSAHDDLDIQGDPAAIWEPWLEVPLTHAMIDSGHHQAEEAPEEVAATIVGFLSDQAGWFAPSSKAAR